MIAAIHEKLPVHMGIPLKKHQYQLRRGKERHMIRGNTRWRPRQATGLEIVREKNRGAVRLNLDRPREHRRGLPGRSRSGSRDVTRLRYDLLTIPDPTQIGLPVAQEGHGAGRTSAGRASSPTSAVRGCAILRGGD